MTPRQVETMLRGFYKGTYDKKNLPAAYYRSFDKRLKDSVNVAFGSKRGHAELLEDLSINRQAFSAAKTYQMSRELQSVRRGSKSFADYVERSLPIYEKYERWGESEINTGVANAQNAKQWAIIEADAERFPKVRYSAVIDEVTSETCKHLDGMVFWVYDPILKKYAPTNHYNCRCTLIQEEKSVRVSPKNKVEKVEKAISKTTDQIFKTNVGITHELFPADHPYFTEVPQKDRAFARKNFGLPIK